MTFKNLVILCVFLPACQSLQVTLPGPVVESPMVRGERGDVEIGWRPGQSVMALSEAGARPYVPRKPNLVQAHELYGKAHIDFLERFELGLALALPGSWLLNGKYQFIGATREARKTGNFTGAVFAAAGTGSASNKGDQAYTFGPGGYNWKASASGEATGFGTSIGYQPADTALIYVGYAYYSYALKWTINQDVSRDGTSPAAYYSGTQKGAAESVALGVEFGREAAIVNLGVQHDWRYWDENEMTRRLSVLGSVKLPF